MSDNQNLNSVVLDELAEMKGEMRRMQQQLALLIEKQNTDHAPTIKLNVFFDKVESERKPYLMRTDGILNTGQKLSPIRAAILLVLLLDLEDRSDEGKGVVDLIEQIALAALILDPEATSDANLRSNIRVALYRFTNFIKGNSDFVGDHYMLSMRQQDSRLEILSREGKVIHERVSLEVTTNHPLIASTIHKTIGASPVARLRKRRAIHVPPGEEGSERLLLELYNNPHPMKVRSLYVRPAFPTYPTSLLEQIGVSPSVHERQQLVISRYERQTLDFTDIFQESLLEDIIRVDERGRFLLYPESVETEHVIGHIGHLVAMLERYKSFTIYLTQAAIPFALVTYEVYTQPYPEYFTVFFQSFSNASSRDLGCFALSEPLVNQSISENILGWILAHPSTIRDKSVIVQRLTAARQHLEAHGPLKLGQTAAI